MSQIIHGLRRMIRDVENGMTAEELLIILNAELTQTKKEYEEEYLKTIGSNISNSTISK